LLQSPVYSFLAKHWISLLSRILRVTCNSNHIFFAGVNSEKSKFFHVISQLEQRCAAELEDIITSPPEQSLYTTLKAELVRRLTPAREQRIRQLLTLEEIGDREPSQLLRHLRSLV
jgi:hypothetical protein